MMRSYSGGAALVLYGREETSKSTMTKARQEEILAVMISPFQILRNLQDEKS